MYQCQVRPESRSAQAVPIVTLWSSVRFVQELDARARPTAIEVVHALQSLPL